MTNRKATIVAFWEDVQKNPWVRASAAAVPVVGPALVQLMSAGDTDDLLERFEGLTDRLKGDVLDEIHTLSRGNRGSVRPVLAIGSGNDEHVLRCDQEVILGQKHLVDTAERFGGSCINYALRLLACGIPVIPIASIGGDEIGRRIREYLLTVANQYCPDEAVLQFLSSEAFFTPGIRTPHTSVLVHGSRRTIFSPRRCCMARC